MDETEALLEELVMEAEEAEEPGDIKPQDVIQRESLDASGYVPQMKVDSVVSAGYVTIYDAKTGESSKANRNMLTSLLKETREDGSRVFTTRRPKISPFRGQFKCHLHSDDPNRPHYDAMGFAVCRKANLTSPFQVMQHMQHRHKTEWATIQSEKAEQQRQEDREFQRTVLEMASKRK
mgnify:CR=1 FL=1